MERVDPKLLLIVPAGGRTRGRLPGRDLRLFRGAAVRFECRCSAARVAGVLRALGAVEIRDLLREQGAVTVTCEFCHRPYRFDSIDIEALFADGAGSGASPALH